MQNCIFPMGIMNYINSGDKDEHMEYVVDLCTAFDKLEAVNGEYEFHYHATDTHGDLFSLCMSLLMCGVVRSKGYVYIDVRTELETDESNANSPFVLVIPNLVANPDFDGIFTIGGNIIDWGHYGMESILMLRRLITHTKKRGLGLHWLMGNHELMVLQGNMEISSANGFYAPYNLKLEYFNIMRNLLYDSIREELLEVCCYVPITKRIASHTVYTSDCIKKKAEPEIICRALNSYFKTADVSNSSINVFFWTKSLIRDNDGKLIRLEKHAIFPQIVGHDVFYDEEIAIRDEFVKEYNRIIPTNNCPSGFYRDGNSLACVYIADKNGIYTRKAISYRDFMLKV